MSVSRRRLLCAATAATLLAAVAAPASAVTLLPDSGAEVVGDTLLIRFAGDDRQGTALSVAQAAQLPTSGTSLRSVALLAASTQFPDALASAPLATALSAPVLLAQGDGSVSAAVLDQLAKYDTVIVVSGAGLIPESTLNTIRSREVDAVRYAGATRYDTAAALTLATLYWDAVIGYDGTSPRSSIELVSAYVADGTQFPDALAAGPVASSEPNGVVLLSNGAALPGVTAAALKGDFGSIAGVDPGVFGEFQEWWGGFTTKVQVQTVGGAAREAARAGGVWTLYDLVGGDRYETAAKMAQFGHNRGLFKKGVVLASGQAFADGVVGGALGGHLSAPLLLTRHGSIPAATSAQITARPADIVTVVGGEGSVSADVVGELKGLLTK